MFKIYLVAIYLFTVRATVLDEHKNNLTNVVSENEKEDLAVVEDSSSKNDDSLSNDIYFYSDNDNFLSSDDDFLSSDDDFFSDHKNCIDATKFLNESENVKKDLAVDKNCIDATKFLNESENEKKDLAVDKNCIDANIFINELENEEQFDPVKYKNLYKIVSGQDIKKSDVEQEINKLLCLDLNLGSEWREEILGRLEKFLENNNDGFGCFLLNESMERLQEERLAENYNVPDNISIEVTENIKLDDLQRKRLEIIIKELFYYEIYDSIKIINFENILKVTINPFDENDYPEKNRHSINERNVVDAIFDKKYLRILLSKKLMIFLEPNTGCLNFMSQKDVPKNIDDNDQRINLSISEHLNNLNEDDKTFLWRKIKDTFCSDYNYFITYFTILKIIARLK